MGRVRVYYDDDCGLCAKFVMWFAERIPDAEFVAQSRPSRSVMVVLDDVQLEEGAALAALFAATGGPWRMLGALLSAGWVQVPVSAIYRVVAANRARISRALGWDTCRVQSPAAPGVTGTDLGSARRPGNRSPGPPPPDRYR